ncbi:Dihydrolipoyllysine-residue succinyltransferase component of 2-oxoglutarate dehydrogenase complex [Candidatus Protochlamydia amoebophila]|uniref:2-oxoglutarate dehydrogenase complex dihydrolipoyllysine-residue succinyltransferase n=1 Tax=Candidatus Protochlamydia amoebophila TaxID=362787 RepID=UPI001BCA5E84|nr:2-oxoglutarate dehydrogenase complex dihydrolipoyllysine-residue succinyltransferase [Candidatus Protochlamydia amoebophila]MBS4163136.1 Dihydrolipoyllysine-residue succinyltransferase component of 2-oxoglutarate dehydrogenase complex [Candidatus Protochlamydia amoebophila]
MRTDIKVPSMGESITEVMIGQILVTNETFVKTDAEILELETDKVNQVLFAPKTGVITLSVQTGDRVKIGALIGFIEEESQIEKNVPQKEDKEISAEILEQKDSITSTFETVEKDALGTLRLTKESYLSDLQIEELSPSQISQGLEQTAKTFERQETRQPLSKIRQVIANRLIKAQQTMAMLTTFNEVDLSEIISLREKHQEIFIKKYGIKLGFMSFFVKAVVSALKAFPTVNSYLDHQDIVERHYYDIGIAVGTDRGTFVPVVRQCDQQSFAQIELAIELFAKKARDGKIAIDDLQGGGFTITNGGVYGSLLSTPILNPPQCAILGMHKIEKRPVVMEDQIVIRPMMYLALSYDHRLIDGKESVAFLVHIKNALEDPSRLLLNL